MKERGESGEKVPDQFRGSDQNRTVLPSAGNRGMALLLVLFLVAIMALLIVAILSISSGELKSARTYADGIGVRQLNETAVSLSVGQLRLGTQQLETITGREVWASQPGAIRIYRENGSFALGVKLYSDSEMTVQDETALSRDSPPADWNQDENAFRYVDLNEPVIRKDQIYFPIADPGAYQTGVQGFDFDESAINGANKNGDRLGLRLPMPVEWLYVLKRGEVGTLDENGVFRGEVTPTEENPIVGRVAFWADDESAKINVNTASEPTFWDTPRALNRDDVEYGMYQPGRNEFQRYAGHPAQTSLSTVFFPNVTGDLDPDQKEQIYGLIPRIGQRGTVGGTTRAAAPVPLDKDRLFATIDEFIFQPNREKIDLFSPEQLREKSFFLTANNSAPELNPLGKPKIAMWPFGVEGVYPRTAYDELIAFCATTGGNLYGFQRAVPNSAVYDFDNIPRNQLVYEWMLRDLSETVPGTEGNFADKFGVDLPQISTQIFDYIRSTNLRDLAPIVRGPGTIGGRRAYASNGQVTPIRTSESHMGFGRFLTISEAGFHIICRGHGDLGYQPAADVTLESDERLIEVGFLMEPFAPSIGFPNLYNDITFRVSGLDSLKMTQIIDGEEKEESMGFTAEQTYRPPYFGGIWHGEGWGGSFGIRGYSRGNPYVSKRIHVKGDELKFSGGKITVEIFSGNGIVEDRKIQTITLNYPEESFPVPELVSTGTGGFRGAGATNKEFWWDIRNRYRNAGRRPHAPGEEYADPKRRWADDRYGNKPGFMQGGVFRQEDVIRTLVPWHGDYRLVAAQREVPADVFLPGPNYGNRDEKMDHLFSEIMGTHFLYGFSNEPGLTSPTTSQTQLTDAQYHYSKLPDVPVGAGNFNLYGDFDTGTAQMPDGAFINRPDEGNIAAEGNVAAFNRSLEVNPGELRVVAYYTWNYREPRLVNYSPNRMVNSPVMFGSLPTGVKRNRPWETLAFRPHEDHPGTESPKDHLLLEYFWMPVVEPYAISVPFATSGKINMNYKILPFSYVERSTGIRAVLKGERPLAVPDESSTAYKLWDHETSDWPFLAGLERGNTDPVSRDAWVRAYQGELKMRKPIDLDKTLVQFEETFATDTLFKYPSEICEMHLVREDETLESYRSGTFWNDHKVTADNVKERPYSNIYPRLTTRSNVFRVHTRAEAIRKSRTSDPGKFDPELDIVVGRYRGSSLIERYINPTNASQPDFAAAENQQEDLFSTYQYRILETRRFSP